MIRSGDAHSAQMVNEAVLAQLGPEESITLDAETLGGAVLHAGDVIVAVDDADAVLNRYVLDAVTATSAEGYVISESTDKDVIDDGKFAAARKAKRQLRDSRDWSTRRRYLNNIRTPLHMPAFTESGFKVI